MIVEEVTSEATGQAWQLSAAVRSATGSREDRLYFTVHGADPSWLPGTGDAFLAALLMPAMSLGEELVVRAPLSRRLLRSARTAMEIYAAWWDRLRPVPIRATPGREDVASRGGVGLFFTAGVDSFYSLLKDLEAADPDHEPVTHLLYVNFEQQSGHDYERQLGRVQHVASQTGRHALVVDTNVRSLTAGAMHWPHYHGAALGSVALALQGLLGRCLIAASDQYCHLPPLGSHPILDHLWSTEGLEIVHDGAEATRTDKVERLAAATLALENLTVCWRSRPAHNCGVCEKCLRTMISLELAGALGRCRTLPPTLNLDQLRQVPIGSELDWDLSELAAQARGRGRHDIADAAEEALRRDRALRRQPVGP